MVSREKMIMTFLVLFGGLMLAGCSDAEKERALADLQAAEKALAEAKSQLTDTQTKLDAAQKERDGLKQELQDLKVQNATQRKRIDELTSHLRAGELQLQQLRRRLSTAREQHTIDKDALQQQAEFEDWGIFAVVGTLQAFATYGPGHYRITDESGKTICYALPSPLASKTELSELIDHKVGLVGTIEPHQQTASALVRFTEIVDLD